MIVLRLGTSEDVVGDVPDEERSYRIAERMLASVAGEPVETILKRTRPTPTLPDIIDRWLDEYRPEMVFLWVSAYWLTYESVPVKLERLLGRPGRPLANLMRKAGSNEWLLRRRVYRLVRRALYRIIGGETNYGPEWIITCMQECIRRVLRYEQATLIVRTPLRALTEDCNAGGRVRGEARRLAVHHALRDFCASLDVHYLGRDQPFLGADGRAFVQQDNFHRSRDGHAIIGIEEGQAMVEAWRKVNNLAAPANRA